MAANPIQIIIQGTADFGRVNEEFERLSASSSGAFNAISKGAKALQLFAEAFAVGEIIRTAREFEAEWVKAARGMAQLDQALVSTRQNSQEFRESLEQQRRALSDLNGVEDLQLVTIQRMLVQYGAAEDQLQALSQLTLDLAASQQVDGVTAANEISKALGGQEVQLRGVRLEIDRSLPKYEQVNQMIQQLSTHVGGQWRSAFLSATPELTRFSNQLKELKLGIGGLIATSANAWGELFNSISGPLNTLTEKMKEFTAQATMTPERAIEAMKNSSLGSDLSNAAKGFFKGLARPEEMPKSPSDRQLDFLRGRFNTDVSAAGVQSASAANDLAMAELERDFALGKVKLRDYLFERRQLIQEASVAEQRLITQTADMLNKEIAQKQAEVAEITKQTEKDDSKKAELIKAQTELNKLLLEQSKNEGAQAALRSRTATNLANQDVMDAGSPTSLVQGIQKGWIDSLNQLGTVYQNLGKTISSTVGTALQGVSSELTGLIEGTTTWSKALQNIGTSVLNVVIDGLVKMFAAMVLGNQEVTTSELARQAATIPGDLVKMLATAVGEGGWAAAALIAAAVAALGVGVAAAAGAFADGGRPEVGKLSLVGERGPELFVADTPGTIIPAHVTSEILSGRSRSRVSSQTSNRREKPQVIQLHAWFDQRMMTKHIRENPDAQHAILEVVGKNNHLVMRS